MIFDLAVAAVFLISCILAFLRGFIRETLTILGVLGGAFAALSIGPHLSPVVRGWLGAEEGDEPGKLFDLIPYTIVGDVAAYGGVFIVVVIILSIISHMLSGWAKAVGLGALDRSFGVLFGIARAVILLALLYMPVYLMVDEETRDGWFADSKTQPYVAAASATAAKMLPQSMAEDIQEKSGGDMAKAARKKLQDLDVLRQEEKAGDSAPAANGPEEGYKDEQRQNLNELIDDGFNN